MIRPRRSALYMPGSNARAIEKARSLPADAIILDLEDSVAPELKPQAREQVSAAVREGGFGQREIVIRTNGMDTQWGKPDLAAAIAAGPDAILLPKVSSPGDITLAGGPRTDRGAPPPPPRWGQIATPQGLSTGVSFSTVGTYDFTLTASDGISTASDTDVTMAPI